MARTVLCAATQGLPAAAAMSHRPLAANGPVGAAKPRLSGAKNIACALPLSPLPVLRWPRAKVHAPA
eukprot:scaffold28799_cov62-Phaeocystis_antarctica.AAC.4